MLCQGRVRVMGVIDPIEVETVKRPSARTRPSNYRTTGKAPAPDAVPHPAPRPSQPEAPSVLPLDTEWLRALYSWVDRASNGRGQSILRLVSFLVVGGSASALNLICVWLFTKIDETRLNDAIPVFFLLVLSTEISLIFNFWLNDRFTFRSLIDRRRTWLQRCLRFHGPASVGFALTLIISNSAHYGAHLSPVTAQAIAIVIVTGVNFVMHRFWTYRKVHSGNTGAMPVVK